LYSHLRFVIAAALIAFGGVIAVGVPALLLAVDRPLLAQTDVSEPPAASSCGQQGWLHFDRNCSQRGLPWAAARGTANAGGGISLSPLVGACAKFRARTAGPATLS